VRELIDASVLKRLARESEAIRVALVRQEHVLAAQTQQVAACNALHELEERLSRWLLQSRDLLSSDTLPLTQEFLAQMLGVQRSSVTLVARKLQQAGRSTIAVVASTCSMSKGCRTAVANVTARSTRISAG
jgi:CRP-like cAMP-binding protein